MNEILKAMKKKVKKTKEKIEDFLGSIDPKSMAYTTVLCCLGILVGGLFNKRIYAKGERRLETLANRLNFRLSIFGYPIKGNNIDLKTMENISKLKDQGLTEKDILKSLNLLDTDRYRW